MHPATHTLIGINLLRRSAAERRSARRTSGDRGEGVISTAIAVLIMAFIGAGMWVAFDSIWSEAEADISDQVENIGR